MNVEKIKEMILEKRNDDFVKNAVGNIDKYLVTYWSKNTNIDSDYELAEFLLRKILYGEFCYCVSDFVKLAELSNEYDKLNDDTYYIIKSFNDISKESFMNAFETLVKKLGVHVCNLLVPNFSNKYFWLINNI